jgi:Na+-driven multidrug efflux pump
MGFNGAALASVIAECVGMLVTLLVIVQKGFKRKYNLLENLRYNKSINKEVLNISVPLVLQFVISVTTWLVFFLLIEDKGVEAKGISNVMRNVFGLSGIFVWAFAATTNTMVSNLIGQGKQDEVLLLVKRIMLWSAGFCSISCIVINIFPALLFSVFTEDAGFVKDVIPVARIVSLGLLSMSIANIWLNSVTGTGKTKINLVIEITAIVAYLAYTLYFMKVNYISLSMAWSNELVYWAVIFSMSFWFMKSGKWKK